MDWGALFPTIFRRNELCILGQLKGKCEEITFHKESALLALSRSFSMYVEDSLLVSLNMKM